MKQTIPNACGTIALLHLAGNIELPYTDWLADFFTVTKPMKKNPAEIGAVLQTPTELSKRLANSHKEYAN